MAVVHKFTNPHPDGGDATKTRPSNWNDAHAFTGGTHLYPLVRDTTHADGGQFSSTILVQRVRFLLTAPGTPAAGDLYLVENGAALELWGVPASGTPRLLISVT